MENLKLKLQNLLVEAKQKGTSNEVAELELALKELDQIIPKANAWDRVWNKLNNNPLINDVRSEHAKHGNCSAASILIDAYEQAYESYEINEN